MHGVGVCRYLSRLSATPRPRIHNQRRRFNWSAELYAPRPKPPLHAVFSHRRDTSASRYIKTGCAIVVDKPTANYPSVEKIIDRPFRPTALVFFFFKKFGSFDISRPVIFMIKRVWKRRLERYIFFGKIKIKTALIERR